MNNCRLKPDKRNLAFTDAKKLIKECRAIKCTYIDSDLDDDELPSGCVILVAGLLASKKEKTNAL